MLADVRARKVAPPGSSPEKGVDAHASAAAAAQTLCAVMPVHAAVDPRHLAAALSSLARQERPADEVVIVEDGPLPAALSGVLDEFAAGHPECRRLRLPDNRGAGPARQHALEAATSCWIALVDSDDICMPNRFRRQLAMVTSTGVDLAGSAMIEFEGSPDNLVGVRKMPRGHANIARYARLRMPVNNPTAVFRRETALAIGGYRDLGINEDYDLVARLVASGATVANTDEPLVLFRSGVAVFRRRRLLAAHRSELQLQRNLHRYGLISRTRSYANLIIRTAYRLLPTRAARIVYARMYLNTTGRLASASQTQAGAP